MSCTFSLITVYLVSNILAASNIVVLLHWKKALADLTTGRFPLVGQHVRMEFTSFSLLVSGAGVAEDESCKLIVTLAWECYEDAKWVVVEWLLITAELPAT